ncbi:MAG: SpoIIIAH-like family protein [Clostridiales bacterium]|jgi:stage III sporulation protein AH|nr:SpoIIIAH-like family protein [Clostridiales bacterium]
MLNMKRNQIIITALVVMIAVAGYLSFTDSRALETPDSIELTDGGEFNPLIMEPVEDVSIDGLTNPDVLSEDIGIALTPEDAEASLLAEEDDNTDSIFVNALNPEGASDTTEEVTELPLESFFVSAKLSRENERSKQKTSYTEMINNKNISDEQRSVVADSILELQERIDKENATETMLEAKGFKEVYVRIDDVTVDVVINKENLSDAEIAQIQDIVHRKTGMGADKIRISQYKK